MFRRTTSGLCTTLMSRVLTYVPDQDVVPLAKLSRDLPDDILESIATEHGSVKEFLRQYPNCFTIKPVGPKNLLTVSRADYVGPENMTTIDPTKGAKAGSGKTAFEDPKGCPPDILVWMEKALEGKQSHGVSSLYGSMKTSDRREIRKYGGILPILRHYKEIFTLSPLGLLVARKAEVPALKDDTSLEVTAEEDAEDDPGTSMSGPATEELQYHAMFLVKYMPLHWTIAPEILLLIPQDVRDKHVIASWPKMQRQLDDFLETKSGVGCRHLIKRLKRGSNIPDIGIIRNDEEMESLQTAQLALASIIKKQWPSPVTWRVLYIHMEKENVMRLKGEAFREACVNYLEPFVEILPNKQMFRSIPQVEVKRTPLWFQALKNTVPKHYVPMRAIKKRLSRGALKEAEKAGGLLEWFRNHKNTFELTLPYGRTVGGYRKSPNEGKDEDLENRLTVRRRNSSYVIITEDQVVEACVNALPKESAERWPLKYLLSMLPADVIDVMPVDVAPYILRVCFPRVYLEHNQVGRMYARLGKQRDDGKSGEPFIGSFEENAEASSSCDGNVKDNPQKTST
ncbi:hypothetical protein XU18_1801 [Perkinsela sp. CCAP 1560/4]|nr:hypothetical protein XU18_1801 [Perkinsela sp. CCAP 1560/4]|eukprot:KNH07269.1 hypothetical protein XU18_1801 [Perkinsela sp. CCAP 1560/4]